MALIDLFPGFYQSSTEVLSLQNALQVEADALWDARNGLFRQFNVESATWGLSIWEKALGIEADASKTDEYRRTRIMAKLRGQGTTTVVMIRNVAESFSNGIVDVIEHPEEYGFDIRFVGTLGIPPNMDDLTAAVEEIKPAHLMYTYIFVYRTNVELKPYTHIQLSGYSHEELRSRRDI